MKPNLRYAILVAICFSNTATFAQAPQPVSGWPYITERMSGALPRFDFIDASDLGIFFNTIDGQVDRFHLDGTFSMGWPLIIDSVMFGLTPVVVDLDHNGQNDVVVLATNRISGYEGSLIFAIDHNGSVMPGFPIPINWPISLNVADFDVDGEYEIMSYSVVEGLIHCFNRLGYEESDWPQPLPDDVIGNTVAGSGGAVGDLDLDGTLEYVIQGLQHIYALRYNGTIQTTFLLPVADTTYHFSNDWRWPPTLGDIDADGFLELFTGADNMDFSRPDYNSFVAVFENTGQIKNGWPLFFTQRIINNAPIPSDINNDNVMEIGFQAGDSMFFIDTDGNRLAPWPLPLPGLNGDTRGSNADCITVDIDGDGDCEIFTDYNVLYADSVGPDSLPYNGYSYLFGVDHNGQPLNGFPIIVNGVYLGRPPNFDLDQTSHRLYMSLFTEVLNWPGHGNDTGYLELFLFPDSTGPTDQWPMLSHDNLHTRNYNFVDRVTSAADQPPPLPHSPTLAQNYPNPFNNSTVIEFTLPQEEQITLTLYDLLGRKVVELYNGRYPAGGYKHNLHMNVPSGLYFYTLQTERTRINRKMTVVK